MSVGVLEPKSDDYGFVIENRNKEYVTIAVKSVTVNDYTDDSLAIRLTGDDIFSDAQLIINFNIDEDFLANIGEDKVKTIEFKLKCEIKGDYRNSFVTDTIRATYE